MRDEVQQYLDNGRDLVGDDWELTDLFPCGRTIAYLPSAKVRASRHGRNGSAFRYNYFVSDADRFTSTRSLKPGVELRITATAVSYLERLQWKVSSMERILGV